MSWYRKNRWLGNFLIAFGVATLLAICFLFHAKAAFGDALTEFNAAATERSHLEHLNPFPNEENFRKTQAELDNYSATLNKLKDELSAQRAAPQWYATLPQVAGLVLNKNETPFMPLYWDRYCQIKTAR